MNWNKGFSALYEIRKVDPVSFLDMGSFDLTAGSITRSDDSLVESADLTMKEDPGECWIRIYLKAKQDGGGVRTALFTGLTSTPERSVDGDRVTYPVECYSVRKIADDTLVRRGYYAPAGIEGGRLAAELLSVGPAPVVIDENSPCLLEPVIAEDTDTNLSMAWKIVDAIGWRIRIAGDGTICICPQASDISATFDALVNDSIEPKISDCRDWYSIPNCFRVISGDSYAEVKNIDENDLSITWSSNDALLANQFEWNRKADCWKIVYRDKELIDKGKQFFNIDLNMDDKWSISNGFTYEYLIFELVHILKIFDWDNDVMIVIGG